jgi:4-amino-4-deoxy-L-arabinose transferase-like glycosyltransferase
VLPLSYVTLNVVVLFGLVAPARAGSRAFEPWLWVGVLCIVALLLHILRAWQLSDAGLRGLLDLLRSPFYLVWKILVLAGGRASKEWVRTKRENR